MATLIFYAFSKAFDIDMCPLPFMLDKMYHFVEVRFSDTSAYVQEQALQWLQVGYFLHKSVLCNFVSFCLRGVIV